MSVQWSEWQLAWCEVMVTSWSNVTRQSLSSALSYCTMNWSVSFSRGKLSFMLPLGVCVHGGRTETGAAYNPVLTSLTNTSSPTSCQWQHRWWWVPFSTHWAGPMPWSWPWQSPCIVWWGSSCTRWGPPPPAWGAWFPPHPPSAFLPLPWLRIIWCLQYMCHTLICTLS